MRECLIERLFVVTLLLFEQAKTLTTLITVGNPVRETV
jgi:hypothetical protein